MAHEPSFFQGNRSRLAEILKGGLIVVTAHDEMQRKADQAFSFEQEANFWYLSGISVPRWKLVYDGTRHHTWLVRPAVDEVERVFNGEADASAQLQASGADEVIDEADFEPLLRQLKRTHSAVHTIMPVAADRYSFVQNPALKQLTRLLERTFVSVSDCTSDVARLRAIKQPNEVKAIERAVGHTIAAFNAMYSGLQSCQYEYEVEAIATGLFRHGGVNHAYDPIVAAGKNACTLHYVNNADRMRKRHLLLCDIGAVYDGYAADITRTYTYGATTSRQAKVLEVLSGAQHDIIRLIKPGVQFAAYMKDTEHIMASALRSLDLDGPDDRELVYKYMPHAVSHGLGIDVHDSLGGYKEFAPGMVLTVEPGIYLPDESIGTRIEDDILVTERGHRNLSAKLASNPDASLVSL